MPASASASASRRRRGRLLQEVMGIAAGAGAAFALVPFARPRVENFAPGDEARWVGPFLLSTFGFSAFFKCIIAGFDQFPEGADRNMSTWLAWFVNLPEPESLR